MEKDQLDSLATVAVGSEKLAPVHSHHYAPSEVYSASESPPAYTRPPIKSTAVQIARIIATTMIAISVIIGSFILASTWLQARATCTPESIAAMQAQFNLHHQSPNEFIKHLQPEALVQNRQVAEDKLQSLSTSSIDTENKDHAEPETKKATQVEQKDNSKDDNDSGDQDDSEDDYDDQEFPPVHIKLPLQLDLDDLAGSLLQQARNLVSCVVERPRSDELADGPNDNSTDRLDRFGGERVAILCQSGSDQPRQEQQEMLTPIIVPLGTVQIPLEPQDGAAAAGGYTRYHHHQLPVPQSQRIPMPLDPRGMTNSPFNAAAFLRTLPQLSMEMGPPPRMIPQPHMMRPIEMRQIPIELRHLPIDQIRGMKPPAAEQRQFVGENQQIPIMLAHADRPAMMYPAEQQQTQGMMPPPPPQPIHQEEQRATGQRQEPAEAHEERTFHGIPIEIRRIIQQVPLEIKNIIQHITGEARTAQSPVPEGARREVQEFKPFPEGIRPMPVDPFALPIEVRNLLEHGNIQGRPQQQQQRAGQDSEEQMKPFPGAEDQGEEAEGKFPVPADVRNFIHQVVQGFPVPRFAMPMRPIESLQVPVEAHAQVSDSENKPEEGESQQSRAQRQEGEEQTHMMLDHEEMTMDDQSNRPHFVQPRSVRSIPEPFAHPREKRVRRCACNCAC